MDHPVPGSSHVPRNIAVSRIEEVSNGGTQSGPFQCDDQLNFRARGPLDDRSGLAARGGTSLKLRGTNVLEERGASFLNIIA